MRSRAMISRSSLRKAPVINQEKEQANTDRAQKECRQVRPQVEHWHGAAPNNHFAYIAVTPTLKRKGFWLKPVSDEEYENAK